MDYYWISFADKTGNLGVVILEAKDEYDAHSKVTALGCNPGGECLMLRTDRACWTPHESVMNRLIPKVEMLEIMKDTDKLGVFHHGQKPTLMVGSVRDVAEELSKKGHPVDVQMHDPDAHAARN